MSNGDNTPGISRLAGTMRKISNLGKDDSLILDYGVINSDGSLKTNTFPAAIPKKDYMVCQWLAGASGSTSSAGDPSHRHSFSVGSKLKAGDRVLVAWVQNDAVVIDKILHGNQVL
jgi:hypothetical protein